MIPELRQASTPADVAGVVLALLGTAAILVAVHVTMRGTFRATGAATPLEALAQLERRHAGRLRLVRVLPWFAAFGLAGKVAQAAMSEGFTTRVVEWIAGDVALLVVYFAVFVRLWLRPRIDWDLREAAEARRLLGEVGDEGSERRG